MGFLLLNQFSNGGVASFGHFCLYNNNGAGSFELLTDDDLIRGGEIEMAIPQYWFHQMMTIKVAVTGEF